MPVNMRVYEYMESACSLVRYRMPSHGKYAEVIRQLQVAVVLTNELCRE